jgi:PPP family 3-phenylpropionic acid transporter
MFQTSVDSIELSDRKTSAVFCALYFLIGIAQFFGKTYMSLFVIAFAFVDEMTLGIIMAINYIIAAFGQFFWGNLADRSKTKNKILFLVLAGTFVATWLLVIPTHQSIATLLPCVMLLNLFVSVPMTIYDAIVVENSSACRLSFGSMRSFSSTGSAVASFLLFVIGSYTAFTVRPSTGMIVMSFAALISLILLRLIPETYGHAYDHSVSRSQQLRVLMGSRKFLYLLMFGFFNFICTGCYVSYYSIFFTSEQGLGGTLDLLNLYGALCIAGEAVLMVICGKLFRKKDMYWIFVWVSVMGACRSLVAFSAPNSYLVMLGGIFQGLTFGPLWGRVAPYIGSIVEDEVLATGQAVWSIVLQGIGPALGALIGGVVAGIVGLRGVFGVIACMHLLTALLFLVLFRAQHRQGQDEHREKLAE